MIHSDQGREFENKIMQELCLLGGAHKTRTTPYHPESDGMVEHFNRTLLMMLAMFAGKNRDDWDDLLPAVMMAYRSSVHKSTGFSPYRLMFGEECTLPMDIGLPRDQLDTSESITSPYALWVRDALEEAYDQVRQHSGQAVQRQKRLYDRRAVKRDFAVGDWVMRYYSPAKKCKLDSPWIGPYLIVSFMGWTIGIQKEPESPVVIVHCQDAKKIPTPLGAMSWLTSKESTLQPSVMILGASTMHRTVPNSLSLTMGLSAEDIAVAGGDAPRSVGPSVNPSGSSQLDVTSATLISVQSRLEGDTAELDSSCVLHPFFVHKMDSGPVRLMTIAHAFNYRMAVLRDGVRSAVRVGRSRKAEKCFLTDVNISWGQQVAVMFQIVSTLMEEIPDFASEMKKLQGVQPRLQLLNSPWGHGVQCVEKCDCLMSDRVDAYVHCLIPRVAQADLTNLDNIDNSGEMAAGFTFNEDCGYLGIGRAGSIPFVSDWLRPVTRGAWRAVLSERVDEPNPVHGPGESS